MNEHKIRFEQKDPFFKRYLATKLLYKYWNPDTNKPDSECNSITLIVSVFPNPNFPSCYLVAGFHVQKHILSVHHSRYDSLQHLFHPILNFSRERFFSRELIFVSPVNSVSLLDRFS